jgi:hypothetical protein
MKNHLDFIVIGGQKCGTTSLFKYIQKHHELYMPISKEAPFFAREDWLEKGLEWYFTLFFKNAPPDALWGTVTPHYLADPKSPRRIFDYFPDIKLIVLLRDPIDRAYSHYMFNRRRGWENRSFDAAIHYLSTRKQIEDSRLLHFCNANETRGYIVWGEYGRMLEKYFRLFPKPQILIVYSEDLLTNPLKIIRIILNFLGVDSRYIPETIAHKYNVGSAEKKINISLEGINKIIPILSLLRFLKKNELIEMLHFWYNIWNAKTAYEKHIRPETYKILKKIYFEDMKTLKSHDLSVPWKHKYS